MNYLDTNFFWIQKRSITIIHSSRPSGRPSSLPSSSKMNRPANTVQRKKSPSAEPSTEGKFLNKRVFKSRKNTFESLVPIIVRKPSLEQMKIEPSPSTYSTSTEGTHYWDYSYLMGPRTQKFDVPKTPAALYPSNTAIFAKSYENRSVTKDANVKNEYLQGKSYLEHYDLVEPLNVPVNHKFYLLVKEYEAAMAGHMDMTLAQVKYKK